PADKWAWVRDWLGVGAELDAEVWRLNGLKGRPQFDLAFEREVTGGYEQPNGANEWAGNYMGTKRAGIKERRDIPATPEAAKWSGWGTALKPAIEPIILARKPLDGTVANNVLAHDVGGLNIDACRVPSGESGTADRFPANVLLDKHAAVEMNNQSDDSSRFFPVFKYQAKAPKKERPVIEREDGTKIQHATVKPLALMEWLVSLIVPPGGVVLDPFAGSGTTLQAALNKGFHPIGIEQDADYIKLIEKRLEATCTTHKN